jgi:hypothetical protein
MRIKGNFLKDYARTVRESPELDWKRYLTEEDWNIINGMVIPLSWYPAETMGRIGRGIFEMRVKKDYKLVRLHGKTRVEEVFGEAEREILSKNSPADALQAFVLLTRRYIDEVEIKLESAGKNFAELSFFPVDNVPSWDLFREIQAGTMEKVVEMNRGKNPRAEFRTEKREGREACIVRVSWD